MSKIIKTSVMRPYFDVNISYREDDIADSAVIREMFIDNVYRLEGYHLKQPEPIVLDIGANIGTFTLLTLKIAQENNTPVKIYAVEPERNNLKLLKKNLEDNPLLFENGSEVVIVEMGISDFTGKSKITDESGGSRLKDKGELQEIDVVTYDEFLDKYKIKKVDFTKIDIEGSELPLLRGASEESIIKSHFYAIEWDRFNGKMNFFKMLAPFLGDFSFETWGVPGNGCNVYLENHSWSL